MAAVAEDRAGIVAAEDQEGYSTTKEVARHLRLEPNTVALWARRGVIPCTRVSRKVIRFRLGEVLAALEAGKSSEVRP